MDVYEAIERRRSVRVFTQAPPEEVVRKIILAGSRAPSAGNHQPWEFIIIDDRQLIDSIAEHKYQQNRRIRGTNPAEVEAKALRQRKAYRNCAVVAVCQKGGQEEAEGTWMCIENMALAATAEGLGIIPSTFWGQHQKLVEKILGLPEGYAVASVVLIGKQEGWPDSFKEARRPKRPDFSWLHRNRFGTNG